MSVQSARIKRISFWIMLLIFAGLTLWWTIYLPYDQAALYRAVPPTATLVSEHDLVAQRWSQIVRNPCLIKTLGQFRAEPGFLQRTADAPGVHRLLNMFAARKTVIAYAPELGPSGMPAWIAASWAGWTGQLLRWGLLGRHLPGMHALRLDDGSRVWAADVGGKNSPLKLSLAVFDGALLGCISEDPLAVRWLLFRLQGRVRAAQHPALGARRVCADMDHGWIAGELGLARFSSSDIRYSLRRIDEDVLEGVLVLDMAKPASVPPGHSPDDFALLQKEAAQILNRMPDLYLLTGFRELRAVLHVTGLGPLANQLERWPGDIDSSAGVFVGLYGGEVSGRILGLRVPSIVVGVRTEQAGEFVEGIDGVLDALNAECGWGLIPRRVGGGGGRQLVGIDGTRSNVYGTMKPEERPALTACGDWILFASNVSALSMLLSDEHAGIGAGSAPRPGAGLPWIPAGGVGDENAYIWGDLEPAGSSIRDALAVFSLGLLVSDVPDSRARVESLGMLNSLLEVLRDLGLGSAYIRTTGEELEIEFCIRSGP